MDSSELTADKPAREDRSGPLELEIFRFPYNSSLRWCNRGFLRRKHRWNFFLKDYVFCKKTGGVPLWSGRKNSARTAFINNINLAVQRKLSGRVFNGRFAIMKKNCFRSEIRQLSSR